MLSTTSELLEVSFLHLSAIVVVLVARVPTKKPFFLRAILKDFKLKNFNEGKFLYSLNIVSFEKFFNAKKFLVKKI